LFGGLFPHSFPYVLFREFCSYPPSERKRVVLIGVGRFVRPSGDYFPVSQPALHTIGEGVFRSCHLFVFPSPTGRVPRRALSVSTLAPCQLPLFHARRSHAGPRLRDFPFGSPSVSRRHLFFETQGSSHRIRLMNPLPPCLP